MYIDTYLHVRTYIHMCVCMYVAGFGAVMAAERKEKLRSQHTHDDDTVKKVDHVATTTKVTHAPKFPKKQSAPGKLSPKDTVTGVKKNQSPIPRKRVKHKVRVCLT